MLQYAACSVDDIDVFKDERALNDDNAVEEMDNITY